MDYSNVLRQGIVEIFQTMVMLDIAPTAEPEDSKPPHGVPMVTGIIGLGGDVKGMLAIYATTELALAATGSMLGMEVSEPDEDVKDTFGELANMLAGYIKDACREDNIDVQLAIPSSVVGKAFHISGFKGAIRIFESFSAEPGSMWIELKYVES